ncbi:ATP-binding protein [Piscinibacter terrae]|uniref:histidine kinase n=1 Tax=Piscinibacter terrae TaxID=2496871 RepID=A0A3N7HP92_9BURK|nr:ATP-binding protein [Albitalea terrae]RQP22551.1 HAMP domain-containing protein [Albitalea terrae]
MSGFSVKAVPGWLRRVRWREQRLGLRLLRAVVLASTLLAALAAGLLVALDYRREIAAIDEGLARLERTSMPSIANSLWSFDETQLRLQMVGLLQQQDVRFVQVIDKGGDRFSAGTPPASESLTREFALRHATARSEIGTLRLTVGLDEVYGRLRRKASTIVVATVAGTLVGGLIMLALFGRWVTRHLEHMARHARRLQHGLTVDPLSLQREPGERPDELDDVAEALNDMTRDLNEQRDQLEVLVARRTADLQRANDDLVLTNRRLEQAQTQLVHSEKMASIGVLAAGVAHEINNPIGFVSSNLGALGGYVADLLRLIEAYEAAEDALGEASPQRLAAIRHAKAAIDLEYVRADIGDVTRETAEGLARVTKIVQDLKDFSHAGESHWQTSDLHKGIDSTLNIVRNEIKYKVEVVKSFGELPPIECLPSEINQVFMNLFVNAAQAIDQRGEIRIATGVDGEGVWAEVSDTGRGIAPEHLPRIFEPFFTTKPVGQGTGLGLALSYAIVKKHHGRLDVRSTPGTGTTFRISLPVSQPEPQAEPA